MAIPTLMPEKQLTSLLTFNVNFLELHLRTKFNDLLQKLSAKYQVQKAKTLAPIMLHCRSVASLTTLFTSSAMVWLGVL